MIRSVLVANRGEIARRVFRTCRSLGIGTVAVYSDADASAAHVREADVAVRLPGSAPADTYLRGELVVRAALGAGADAVHPGYGFLSEDAGFATAVSDAGLVWIGPPPSAISAMASKTRAKSLMGAAGVPLLSSVDPAVVTAGDLPVMVKASAGGGGRGMRVVRDLPSLSGELASARAEAAAAFGDGSVFVEPYVEGGRHVEVQILADAHGTVWALGTRDCSLQRRHQKVVEEAPAPGLSVSLRDTLRDAAVAAASAVDYRGAGTVEFLVSGERAWFLEMNTRLQVEHPVTECVYGVDLVALQIRVAEGYALGAPPSPVGHAVSARLYAEDPARSWRPWAGVVHRLSVGAGADAGAGAFGVRRRGLRGGGPGPYIYGPGTQDPLTAPTLGPQIHVSVPDPHPCDPVTSRGASSAGLRVDSGVDDGDVVGVHYDPMLAKVIAWAPTRAEAVRRLAYELERARIHGPVTNRSLLVRSLRHPEFLAGEMDTGFYDRHLLALTGPDSQAGRRLAALVAALADAAARRVGGPGVQPPDIKGGWVGEAPSVPNRIGGWRNVPSQSQVKRYRAGDDEVEIRYRLGRGGLVAEGFDEVRLVSAAPSCVVLEVGGVRRGFEVACYSGGEVHVDSSLGSFALAVLPRFPDPTTRTSPGSLLAPMPGTVVRVADGIAVGKPVQAGQPLMWLEAMKMEHRVVSPADGTLTALHAVPGRQVEVGALLAVVTTEETTP
ncbi:acetyl/propionyl/methylcrotonyl-CoA carboxylase subunit alpha [Streptomyces netropsis]|uniref:acetyl/propionyl/methylcrotonyl-CoA carboxylase subunit alpha n=1 Tax=Streptomyces netropsis TaxID=55404 RepID=UPI00378E324A